MICLRYLTSTHKTHVHSTQALGRDFGKTASYMAAAGPPAAANPPCESTPDIPLLCGNSHALQTPRSCAAVQFAPAGAGLGSPMRQTMVGTHLEVNGLPACLATLGSDLRSPPAGIDGLKAWHEAATASTTASRCSMCSSTERPECRFANRHSVSFTLTITVGHAVHRFPRRCRQGRAGDCGGDTPLEEG